MPSVQARVVNALTRLVVRRRHWGDEAALTRRARRVFGPLPAYGALLSFGLRREPFDAGGVTGEWTIPKPAGRGVILYLHGGGFVSCSFRSHRPITSALARHSGRRVLSLDYRLAPEHRFPAGLDDCRRAYDLLRAAMPAGEPIALAGDSAGGNMAVALAARVSREGAPMPGCIVAFSPWLDLAGTGESARRNDGPDAMFRYENLAEFAAAYLGPGARITPDASPLHGELPPLPPLLVHVGSTEILLDDARRLCERVSRARGACELEVFDDVSHCWQMLAPWVPEATRSLRAAARFIAAH